ncbi:MAG: hypothetical protein AAGD25_26810 [Cyanobacteria bacterium P01_F01_bin.150]
MEIDVDGLTFTFPDTWQITKYDDWAFYRKHFLKIRSGIKSVDLIVLDDDQTVRLVEVKDYRQQQRQKQIELAEEMVQKVLDTLAAMLPAKVNASNQEEKDFAQKVVKNKNIRVVLHLDQPGRQSRLFPRKFDLSREQLKLRTKLKAIDPHPKVVESSNMQNLVWTVK